MSQRPRHSGIFLPAAIPARAFARWWRRNAWALLIASCLACATGQESEPDVGLDLRPEDTGAGDTAAVDTAVTADTGAPSDTAGADSGAAQDTTNPSDTHVADTAADAPDLLAPASLGRLCGLDPARGCTLDSTSWPSCAHQVCDGGECVLGLDLIGHCSRSCQTPADCRPASDSAVGTTFGCVAAGTESFCVPGSNTPCDANTGCSGGEVCKLGYAVVSGQVAMTTVCQTATGGGAGVGQPCNTTEPAFGAITHCANDLCVGSRCSSFCDPLAPACGTGMFECLADVEIVAGFNRDLCLGKRCNRAADCTAPGFACAPPLLFTGPPDSIGGYCQVTTLDPAATPLGGSCANDDACASGWCLEAGAGGQCSVLCRADTDCASNQKCGAVVYELPDGSQQATPVCLPAAGSRTPCTGNLSCTNGEVCRAFLVGQPSAADPYQFQGSISTLCAQPLDLGGAAAGAACNPGSCANDYCVSDDGSRWFCAAPCTSDSDCAGAMTCTATLELYDNPPFDLRICVP